MEQYTVTGMSCAACSTRVEKAVSKVPGVTSCSVSLLTNSMGVEGTASEQDIVKAVTDAACAGALMVALSGDNYYFGKLVKKPQIGDAIRPLEVEDIKRSHVLLYISAFLMVAAVLGLRVAVGAL